MKSWFKRLFCRHQWSTMRWPLVVIESGEVCGVAVKKTCEKCGTKKVRFAT